MSVIIEKMFGSSNREDSYTKSVLDLGMNELSKSLDQSIDSEFSHLIVSTTCPDTIAPSLGQKLAEKFSEKFKNTHVIDMVQGCAGGVSALILASQLASLNKSNVMVVLADAARKSVEKDNPLRMSLSNGAFACLITYRNIGTGLIHSKTRQYKGLSEIVSVKLGHITRNEIVDKKNRILESPLENLGLYMNPLLAVRLLNKANSFYKEFISECNVIPEVIIFHQVNSGLMKILKAKFSTSSNWFVDLSNEVGNCGAASVGVALSQVKNGIVGKKVFLCSFGTGGVITAALWQF